MILIFITLFIPPTGSLNLRCMILMLLQQAGGDWKSTETENPVTGEFNQHHMDLSCIRL